VTPIDQFRHSPHVEMVGVFSRPTPKGRKRGLLG
jgi:23S rRNA (uracil1939-C5)-methyltransferase